MRELRRSWSQVGKLSGRLRHQLKKRPEGSRVRRRIAGRQDVQGRDEIAPPQELSPKRRPLARLNREIGKLQNTLIAAQQPRSVWRRHELCGAMHLIGDHEHALSGSEARPSLWGQPGVLAHVRVLHLLQRART
jgi:hypothetical protein